MTTYTIRTAGGWTYTGVLSTELKRKLQEIAEHGDRVVSVTPDSSVPARYDLDTVHWSGVRDKVKQEIATRGRSKYEAKARELITHYQNVIKGLEADAKKYPHAAAGLRTQIAMYQRRIRELQNYLRGGDAPDWFAKLFVHKVTSSDLARLSESTKKKVNLKTGFYVPVQRVAQNTGIKTVPKPQPKPSHVVHSPITAATA